MRIYLAGKIDDQAGEWRTHIVGTRHAWSRNEDGKVTHREVPNWIIERAGDELDLDFEWIPWPTKPNRLALGIHEYVGPYRQTLSDVEWKNKGEFHGCEAAGGHGAVSTPEHIISECLAAIRRADLVFAYLNAPACYGTVAEIGYAAALGKFVYVVTEEGATLDNHEDFWFVEGLATNPYAPYIDDGSEIVDETSRERCRVMTHLRHAFVQWAAWTERRPSRPPTAPAPVTLGQAIKQSSALVRSRASFELIARWTSDPRVREEANRMAHHLSTHPEA